MKKTIFLRVVAMMLALVVSFGALGVGSLAAESVKTGSLKGESGTAATLEEMQSLLTTSSYEKYLLSHKESINSDSRTEIPITVTNFIGDAMLASVSKEIEASKQKSPENWTDLGSTDGVVFLPSVSSDGKAASVTWNFEVEDGKQGFYSIQIEYFDCIIDAESYVDGDKTVSILTKSSVSAIERKLSIRGVIPFDEVSSISFDKHWEYDYKTVSEPVEVSAAKLPFTSIGSVTEYEHIESGDNKGYYKYVTTTYPQDGKLMQTVTTYKISQDINGNSMAPEAKAISTWSTHDIIDTSGYSDGALKFYLANGTQSITLEAIKEPMLIKSIKLIPTDAPDYKTDANGNVYIGSQSSGRSYSEYIDYIRGLYTDSAKSAGGIGTVIEAEFPDFISDSSVAPTNDNTSAITSPISPKAQLFNVIGENSYSAMGQWAAYKFSVDETGFYKLGARFKQDTLQGMFICRTLKLSGGIYGKTATVPFDEAYRIRFGYASEWQSEYMGYYYDELDGDGNVVRDDKGNPVQSKKEIELFFEEGVEYTLYLECSLGDLKEKIKTVEESLNIINACYLRILQRTGAEPDKNQDYSFMKYMPEVLVSLLEQAKVLTTVADELEALCGTNGSHIATLDNVARILTTMGADGGEKIAENMSNLKSNLGTLGTWINDSKTSSLMLDSVSIVPSDSDGDDIPYATANFFESIWFEISSFIYSFFTDYDKMGLTSEEQADEGAVQVWLAMGRDQSQIWRSMIDAKGGFTDTYGKGVALKLVTAGTLLPSILSGKGPDVYLGLGSGEVINYAIRNAIIGVSGNAGNLTDEQNAVFSNYWYADANGNEIKSETKLSREEMDARGLRLVSNAYEEASRSEIFADAAMKTLTLCDVTYGLPMTMSFAMMFYRMDVLGELGLEVPETWDELLGSLPMLQSNNMTIGVSYVSALDFMIYQMGESMWRYEGDEYDSRWAGAAINLDSNVSLEAFDFVCSLYTEHSLPVTFDTANRFRTGEMPITIGDYISIYNSLVVFASEIGGVWEFSSLPGSKYEDEKTGKEIYNYDSLAGVGATVLLNGCQDSTDTLLAAWQFMQWQTSREVQAGYGNAIVALIGPAAKYETANKLAINDLSWTAKEKAAISDQMAHLDAIVNYPGSYIISRYMKFAFLDVYNDGLPANEAMMSYIDAINSELTRKRDEFSDYLFSQTTWEDAGLNAPPKLESKGE